MTISETGYLNAAMAAKELASRGIHLSVAPSSVLGELLELSASWISPKTTNMAAILSNPGVQSGNFSEPAECRASNTNAITRDNVEQSQHSLKIAALADDIAPFVLSHCSFARNVVTPLVVDLAGKMEKYAATSKPLDPVSKFEIFEGVIPELALDESFLSGGLEQYRGLDVQWSYSNLCLVAPAEEEYYSGLMQLSSERLNELVAKWLRTQEEEFVKKVFVANFCAGGGDLTIDYSPYVVGRSSVGPYERMNVALVCYILANRVYTDVQPTTGSMSLTEYKSAVRQLIDYAGSEATKALSLISRQMENGVMVTEATLSKKCVVVHQPLYRAWLQSGGKPEVLLGMLVGGQVTYAVSAIEESKEQLLRQWQTYVTLTQADLKAEAHKRFREYVIWEMSNSLSELTESEIEFGGHSGDLKKHIMDRVTAEVEHLSHRLMDDFYHTALHLVAKGRFYYTSAYDILSEMVQVSKDNAEIDPREAVLLSTITYLASYNVAQILVTK